MRSNKLGKSLLLALAICLLAIPMTVAQPETDPEGNPDAVPIAGLGLLLGAGAVVGVKRLLERKKV